MISHLLHCPRGTANHCWGKVPHQPASKEASEWKKQERELESIWGHALFTCIATALRPPQRKGLRFHQCRLVSNLLLMATLHPILFLDLLDSIIVSIIKAISSKVRTNEENISKHGASGCYSLLESLRNGFNYTIHTQDYSITEIKVFSFGKKNLGMNRVLYHTVYTAKPETFLQPFVMSKVAFHAKLMSAWRPPVRPK